ERMHGRDERIRVRDFYGGLEFYNRFVRALAVPEPFPSGLRGTHCFESGTFSDAVHLMKFFTSSTRPRFPENPPPPRHWGASLGQGCDGIMCFCAFGKYVGPKYERPIPFRGRYSFRWDTSKDASRCSTRAQAPPEIAARSISSSPGCQRGCWWSDNDAGARIACGVITK